MKKSVIFLVVLALFACDDNKTQQVDSRLILTRSSTEFMNVLGGNQNYAGDPFKINGADIRNDSVIVSISYSGGCTRHNFKVIWNEAFAKSNPPQTEFILVHDAQGDGCEAYITENLSFSLSDLTGPVVYDTVLVSIINGNSPDDKISLIPWPAKAGDVTSVVFPQGDFCQVEVTASTVICGAGLFDNLWFALKDSVNAGGGVYFKKWLQPVALTDELKNFKPVAGKRYLAGARIQKNHPFNDAIVCLAYSGPSVPVKITCISELK
ncbi:MAG TPA: hypothetical protein VHO46_03165 [Bacteroidales bacterium]|nr:hypothetical protein [Bacteroidales bacterium]